MKKILICSSIILAAMTALNINMIKNSKNYDLNMKLKSLESFAYDLPEVNVICSTNPDGPCWKWEYYQDPNGLQGRCTFTGYMDDLCSG